MLAGPQDGARPLPAHHALLRPQLEDHLWARCEAPSGRGRLPSRGHPGARREDPPQASLHTSSQGLRHHRARGGEPGRRPVEGPGQDGPQLRTASGKKKPKPVCRPLGDEVCAAGPGKWRAYQAGLGSPQAPWALTKCLVWKGLPAEPRAAASALQQGGDQAS